MSTEEKTGTIELFIGPMFASKTTRLMGRIETARNAGLKCIIINYVHDERYGSDCISSHDKKKMKAIMAKKLMGVDCQDYDIIAIDEGQFFKDIVLFCKVWVKLGKEIIIAALDGTYEMEKFGKVLDIIPMADKVVKLRARCTKCSKPAPFTCRIVKSDKVELIGGSESYEPRCRKCFKM